ncbi:MAG TPA: hypothetical protein VKZ94_19175 [Advenella sp.]|nr:hypothetical protein [Advenella sp.]
MLGSEARTHEDAGYSGIMVPVLIHGSNHPKTIRAIIVEQQQ